MKDEKFIEIKCLSAEEQEALAAEIKKRIKAKLQQGLLTEREVEEIQHLQLEPLPDIQDVQSVYEDFMYQDEKY
ncbi:MAG: hypothetical protein B5M54_00470 [Candidatus Aminicenantes bacterium 4484_214]|nr:MAG: hypothetical protein B5M54_00470 [Candidatus Aminicenantes bacterium 4484_214]RLE06174.1 MAG: hypothetical protein DRJ06_08185 [Candidatus Aminicenantes bacterium]